ncbi:MAG: NAD(P)-dependent oxidoreductase [Phycisphaerales bacterium]|nr:NAD(P)-dependent oxidoreductase [Phycisphaerales bacterium]
MAMRGFGIELEYRSMRIAIIGTSGQLGHDLARLLPGRGGGGHEVLSFSGRKELDITDTAKFAEMLDGGSGGRGGKPDAVINTAAFHNVDLCETETDAAYRTNVVAVREMAKACESRKILFVQIGTDYVFGQHTGTPQDNPGVHASACLQPIPESAAVSPNSIYALTRFGGDSMTLTHAPTVGYIVRSCGLFGLAGCKLKGGLNFVDSMIQAAKAGKPLRVVNDQTVSPTPTDDLANQLATILENRIPPGLYHAVSHGQVTWYEFAKTALELAKVPHQITPVTSAAFAAPAKRPAYSALDNAKLRALGLDQMRPWRESLERYIQRKYR